MDGAHGLEALLTVQCPGRVPAWRRPRDHTRRTQACKKRKNVSKSINATGFIRRAWLFFCTHDTVPETVRTANRRDERSLPCWELVGHTRRHDKRHDLAWRRPHIDPHGPGSEPGDDLPLPPHQDLLELVPHRSGAHTQLVGNVRVNLLRRGGPCLGEDALALRPLACWMVEQCSGQSSP